MKNTMILLFFLIVNTTFFAHEGGHGAPLKQWELTTTSKIIKADFIQYENEEVWLMDDKHRVQIFQISDFTELDQKYIKTKKDFIYSLNSVHTIKAVSPSISNFNWALIALGSFLLCFSIFKLIKKKKAIFLTHGALGLVVILIVSCKTP